MLLALAAAIIRPATAAAQTKTFNQGNNPQMGQQGGRGGGNNNPFGQERAGSTRILWILEEGTPVKEGDKVCELDSAALEDERRAQLIRFAQAKSWVEQAESALKSAKIALDEYRDGIYPQDLSLIDQYTDSCRIQLEQFQRDLDWERAMFSQGLRSDSQLKAARYKHEKGEIALRDAQGIREQLVKYTGPKVVAELQAKIAAVESDLQAQKAAFTLEEQRKRDLEKAIANCVLYAPRDGIVVYYQDSNGWGRVENQIREGQTVRENQPIFMVPNPEHMLVKVRVNESKVSYLNRGTPALVRVDAFPGRLLHGKVTKVTVIPTPANGPFSDVKVYFAMVEIEQGFEGLRTGMSAKVDFLIDRREDVVRVPVRSIRWFDGEPFVALPGPEGRHSWKHIKLGLMNTGFAEVLAGLRPLDRVVADPGTLDPPDRSEREAAKAESWDIAAAIPNR